MCHKANTLMEQITESLPQALWEKPCTAMQSTALLCLEILTEQIYPVLMGVPHSNPKFKSILPSPLSASASLSSSPCVYIISLLFFFSFFRRISLEKPKPSKLSMFYALMPFPMGPPDSWVNISHTLHLHKSVYTLLSQIKWKHKFLR